MRVLSRLGLRAQIVLSLSAVFALSFWLFAFTTVQLTRRSAELERVRTQQLVIRTLTASLEATPELTHARVTALCQALSSRIGLRALHVHDGKGRVLRCGDAPATAAVRASLADGGWLLVWLAPTPQVPSRPITALLLFYLALTGLAVLLLAYVALTYLIVGPLERLTHSADSLAAGGEHQFVRERGAAEVVQLAQTFNQMAVLLRAERKRLVDRLAQLERATQELEQKEQQLIHGEKLASIGRLAAGIAHEIGNPLAAILGFLDLLREGDLSDSDAREFLARIHRETERINEIIRDLLDFARRDVGPAALHEATDLHGVIVGAVDLMRPQQVCRDVHFEIQCEPDVPKVLGPAQRLTQVVLNLLLNAVDALNGKGKIEIHVGKSSEAGHVLLRITDDGPGIAVSMLDKLFEPFSTTKPAGKGTGLGLAVTAAIVDGLSGTISAHNRPEGGACFEIRLMVAPPPAATSTAV